MARVPTKYLELIKSFPLRPIHNEHELRKAEAVLHYLLDAESLTAPEEDYLLLLGNVIEEYEAKAHPLDPLAPHEMLKASMEAKGMNQTELSKATDIPISTISDLLSKKRPFNVALIEKLCAFFGLEPGVFIRIPTAS